MYSTGAAVVGVVSLATGFLGRSFSLLILGAGLFGLLDALLIWHIGRRQPDELPRPLDAQTRRRNLLVTALSSGATLVVVVVVAYFVFGLGLAIFVSLVLGLSIAVGLVKAERRGRHRYHEASRRAD